MPTPDSRTDNRSKEFIHRLDTLGIIHVHIPRKILYSSLITRTTKDRNYSHSQFIFSIMFNFEFLDMEQVVVQ